MRERLKTENVALYKNISIITFLPNGIIFCVDDEEIKLEGYEDIVLSMGMEPVKSIKNLFKNKDIQLYIIGDAKTPGLLIDAITEADEIGRSI